MKFKKKYITADPKPVKQAKNSIKQPAEKRMNWEKNTFILYQLYQNNKCTKYHFIFFLHIFFSVAVFKDKTGKVNVRLSCHVRNVKRKRFFSKYNEGIIM
jgi:hypothetical protein